MTRNRSIFVVVTAGISLLVVASLILGSGVMAWLAAGSATATPTATRTFAPTAPPTATITGTPDPCGPANLPGLVIAVHALMREFDDTSLLAQNTPIQSVSPLVSDLQRIRRAAEDQVVPACLRGLKEAQLAHMGVVLTTFLSFLNGSPAAEINPLIEEARQHHSRYDDELARLMGWTPVPSQTPSTPAPAGA